MISQAFAGYPRKASVRDLAMFGGPPLFDRPRTIGQLYTPDFAAFEPMLREILRSGRLSDHGPYVQKLESRLAARHEVPHCIAIANAALGLVMLMQIFGGECGGQIAMPCLSYRGLPHFAAWAGHEPLFCDVDPATHTLDSHDLERRITDRTRAILAVATCYSSGAIDDYLAIGARHGLPVIFDSVNGIGMTSKGRPLGGAGAAEVFSLHATKLVNGFEGGYVTTHDAALADRLRTLRDGVDVGAAWGLEARLNEVHAALALLSLDGLDAVVERNRAQSRAYHDALEQPGLKLASYPARETYGYELAVLEVEPDWPITRDQMVTLLRAERAIANTYYAPPLYKTWQGAGRRSALPAAEALEKRLMQLPAGDGVSLSDIAVIGKLIALIRREWPEIARRLSVAAS